MSVPRYITPLRGRDEALGVVLAATDHPGATTVIGPGGVGKTRLAVEVAQRARRAGRDAWFVHVPERASLSELGARVLSSLEVPGGFMGSASPPERIATWLERSGNAVLVLDEAEVASEAVHDLVGTVASHASVLVTSRRPLDLMDESLVELDCLTPQAATEVFRDAAPRGTVLDPSDVARAVGHLQGLPLAIELAAARLEALPMHALVERLANPETMLRDPAAEGRHAAVWDSLTASFDALPPVARHAALQLAVFAGDVALDAAEGVVVLDGSGAVLDALHLLTRRCLYRRVSRQPAGPAEARYRPAPFVRDFLAGLPGAADPEALQRHATWFADRAIADTYARHRGDSTSRWLEREETELAAVVERALRGRVVGAGVLARSAVGWVFGMSGRRSTADRLAIIDRVLDALGDRTPHGKGKLLEGRCDLLGRLGRTEQSMAAIREAERLARQSEDLELLGAVLGTRGNRHDELGQIADALAAWEEAIDVATRCGNARSEVAARVAITLTEDFELAWRPARSVARLTEAVERAPVADQLMQSATRIRLGEALLYSGQPEAALSRFSEALAPSRASEVQWAIGAAHLGMARAHVLSDDLPAARHDLELAMEAAAEGTLLQMSLEIQQDDAVIALIEGDSVAAAARTAEAQAALQDAPAHFDPYRVVQAILEAWRRVAGDLDPEPAVAEALERSGPLPAPYASVAQLARLGSDLLNLRAELGQRYVSDVHDRIESLARDVDGVEPRYCGWGWVAVHWLRHLLRACRQSASAWRFSADGCRFWTSEGVQIDAGRHKAAARMLATLVAARFDEPGSLVSRERLVAAGWPGEALRDDVARNRFHVAMSSLRKLGLTVVERVGGDYRLDPEVPAHRV